MTGARTKIAAGLGLIALAVTACTQGVAPANPVPTSVVRPDAAAPKPPQVARPTSKQSAELRSYFKQVQNAQLGQGLLRRDNGSVDAPFTDTMLARNFEKIAFYHEYDGNFSGPGGASPLRRWADPVRMEVIYGAGVPQSQRANDTAQIRTYAARLKRVTGHPVSMGGKPNFIIIVAGEDDRAAALTAAQARVPGISSASLKPLITLRRDIYCVVAAYAGGVGKNTYTAALAVIRAENPDLMRLACIHEELAQGMGLANDSPTARPSIFNDDDEFALLTRHDELLLQMLYDPRLRPGMNADQARATVRTIATELMNAGPV